MASEMSDKVCLVTGATNGIGKSAAVAIARLGADLTIVGRNPEKTARVVEELKRESGNERVSSLIGDLSLVAETRRVAREFKAGHERLDLLVNNAGTLFPIRRQTAEGLETTFALNHLGYFVMAVELLDLLRAASPSRIVNTSSEAQRIGAIDFDDLLGERRYSGFRAYGRSKLANVMLTRELARRLEGTGVTVTCMHPGAVSTGFGDQDAGVFMRGLMAISRPFMRTADQGADTLVWLATSPEVEGLTGKYFANRKEKRPHRQALDDEACARLWRLSEEMVARVAPAA